MTVEDLWSIPRVGSAIPSHDGKTCAVTVTTYDLEKNEGITRIWLLAPGAEPKPLTAAELSSNEPAFSPDGKRLAFTRKADGKQQLHVMPLDGGEPRRLTSLPLGVFDPTWLPDGSGIVFASKLIKGHLTPEATAAEIDRRAKDPVKAHVTEERFFRHWDTWLTTGEVPHFFLYDFASESIRDLTPASTLWLDFMEPSGQYDLAPDGKEIVFSAIAWDEARKQPRSAIYTVPVAGGAVTCLTPDHPDDDDLPRYSPDGKSIVYGMQQDIEFYADRVRIVVYDRATKRHTTKFESWDRSPAHWEFAADGTLVLVVEDAGRTSLFVDRGGEQPETLVRGGTAASLRLAGSRAFFTLQTYSEPPEAYTVGLDGKNLERLTRFTEAALARFGVGEVRETTFEGAAGDSVQMFIVLPSDHREGQKLPLVHMVHGGPHGVFGDGFAWRWCAHLFASPGYAIALVNFHGSTSFGQEYTKSILGEWGDKPFHDVMTATDLLIASGLVDANRMAVAGASYGGYLVSWIAGHTDRFRCIVNHAGVYDTLSQYASDWTMGRNRSFGGEPWSGLDVIDRYNPARFTSGFNTPMLVSHGEQDYRVPVAQGLECYGVLKAKGIPARLVYFPDENHWVLKPRNSIVWNREVHAWLERWLKS